MDNGQVNGQAAEVEIQPNQMNNNSAKAGTSSLPDEDIESGRR